MKVIVLGCNHAGTAAITQLRQRHPDVEVVAYDRNDNISFLACGIALWVADVVKDPKGLFYASPESLTELGAEINMRHDVEKIDFERREVHVKNLDTGETSTDTYDKLILATGSWPVTPPIPGIDLEGVKLAKLYQHAQDIIDKVNKPETENAVVVGAGYIGVELVEAFHAHDKNVTLVEAEDRILSRYFDEEFTPAVEERMRENGIAVKTSEKVSRFEGENGKLTKVVTNKGEYPADIAIFSTGFAPNSELYKDVLDTMPNGAVKVDGFMRSSRPEVMACGDCAAVRSNATGSDEYIALATNAVRMGIMCAVNIKEAAMEFPGVQGSNAIKVFDHCMASTGLSETAAKARGMEVKTNFVEDSSRAEFMPEYDQVKIKVVYDAATRRLLGAQIASDGDYTLAIHTISLAIQKKMTVDEFALVDFFFLPHFNKPVSYLTAVALTAP